jgi:hypothetical protein
MATEFKRKRNGPNGEVRLDPHYTIKFKDVRQKWRQLPAFTDLKSTREMGRKLDCVVASRLAGKEFEPEIIKWLEGLPEKVRRALAKWQLLDGQSVAMSRPLTDHLNDYKQALLDGIASARQKAPATTKHTATVHHRVTKVLEGIGAKFLNQVKPEAVGRFLAERRTQNPKDPKKRSLSVQTTNHWIASTKAFLAWMVRTGRASKNPLT